jgi:hypothetical protein
MASSPHYRRVPRLIGLHLLAFNAGKPEDYTVLFGTLGQFSKFDNQFNWASIRNPQCIPESLGLSRILGGHDTDVSSLYSFSPLTSICNPTNRIFQSRAAPYPLDSSLSEYAVARRASASSKYTKSTV